MIAAWLLMACTSDPAGGDDGPVAATFESSATGDTGPLSIWRTDERYVWVDPVATKVESGRKESGFGSILSAGSDLDKNGVSEWAVGVPSESDRATVRVFEGSTPIADRRVRDPASYFGYPSAIASGDLDGDGFADVAIGIENGIFSRILLVTAIDESGDRYHGIHTGEPIAKSAARPLSLSAASDLLTVGWRSLDGTGATRSSMPTDIGAGSWEDPHVIRLELVQTPLVSASGASRSITEPIALERFESPDGAPVALGVIQSGGDGQHGEVWVCPNEEGLGLEVGCTQVAEGDMGGRQVAGDLDGDGVEEVVTSGFLPTDAQGTVTVLHADGTVVATIVGTGVAQLGVPLRIGVDGAGLPWLLVGQYNWNGMAPAMVYAFRGSDLAGELTDQDAERVYVSEVGTRIEAIEVYRETPDADPILLLGHPAASAVYMLPFDPGSPMKAETP